MLNKKLISQLNFFLSFLAAGSVRKRAIRPKIALTKRKRRRRGKKGGLDTAGVGRGEEGEEEGKEGEEGGEEGR